MEKHIYTCIVCPLSCKITVTDDGNGDLRAEGNTCKRGEEFALNEFTDPKRMLTSTIKVNNGVLKRLPVISSKEIPKRKIKECLDILYSVEISAPVKCGDVVVNDILGLGVDIVASRSLEKK